MHLRVLEHCLKEDELILATNLLYEKEGLSANGEENRIL